jgi:hypothetical protein
MKRLQLLTLLSLCFLGLEAQEKPRNKFWQPDYDRKEEMIFDGKRYRIHNSYLSLGGGYLQSTLRQSLQKTIGIDFQFPIRWANFQTGVLMSGEEFGSNNNVQGHICYGLRREKRSSNFAVYAGPAYYTGVLGDATGNPVFYEGVSFYACGQAVVKFAYDIGIGAELFVEFSKKQNMMGLKFIAFFSGAYRGPKRNFNPNVRSENPK